MIEIMLIDFVSRLISHASKRRVLSKGAFLFHQGDPVTSVFVLQKGSVELTRFQEDGEKLVLQRAGAATFLAEASVYSDVYHCDAAVVEPSVVHEMSRAAFLRLLEGEEALFHAWAAQLAREVQATRYRCEILSLKTVAQRLDGWFEWKGGTLPPKGQWKSLAHQIGVSPEALYREIARRRKEV